MEIKTKKTNSQWLCELRQLVWDVGIPPVKFIDLPDCP